MVESEIKPATDVQMTALRAACSPAHLSPLPHIPTAPHTYLHTSSKRGRPDGLNTSAHTDRPTHTSPLHTPTSHQFISFPRHQTRQRKTMAVPNTAYRSLPIHLLRPMFMITINASTTHDQKSLAGMSNETYMFYDYRTVIVIESSTFMTVSSSSSFTDS